MPSIMFTQEAEEKREFKPLAEGNYNFEILDSKFGESAKGTEFMELTLREVATSKRVWQRLYFAPTSFWKLKSLLESVGHPAEAGVSYEINPEFAAAELHGKQVGGAVSIEEYNGKENNRVDRFSTPVERPF